MHDIKHGLPTMMQAMVFRVTCTCGRIKVVELLALSLINNQTSN